MSDQPVIKGDGDTWTVEVPGDATPYRVLTWVPPHLVLARGREVRHFFVAPSRDGVWIGDHGHVRHVKPKTRRRLRSTSAAPGHDDLSSPMPGKVLEVLVDL